MSRGNSNPLLYVTKCIYCYKIKNVTYFMAFTLQFTVYIAYLVSVRTWAKAERPTS